LYLSEIFSGAGDGIFWVALIAAISDDARFSLLLAVAVLVRLGPRALLSIPGGGLVDRSNLRRLLIGIEIARMTTMSAAAVAVQQGASNWVVLAIVCGCYLIGVPTRPGLSTALQYVVGETSLAGANATLSTIRQVMTFIGPLIGVAIVAWSTTAGFIANAASFGLSAISIALVRGVRWPTSQRRSGQPSRTRTTRGRDMLKIPGFGVLVGLVGVMYLVRGVEMVVHVLVIRDLLHEPPTGIGIFGAAIGIGAIAAAPLARRTAAAGYVTGPILLAIAMTAVPTAGLVLCSTLGAAAGLLVFVGAGMVIFEVVSVITIQRSVSRTAYGRAFGALNGSSNLGKLLGAIAAPVFAELIGLEATLVGVALFLVIVALCAVPALRSAEATSSRQRNALRPIVEALSGLALFDGASPIALERLASEVQEDSVASGTTLIREGDQPDDLFVVRSGELVATVAGDTVGSIGAGDWFGEIGLVERRERTASVTARDDVLVWRIPGQLFLDVLEDSGAAPSALTEGIADRLAVHHRAD
jgi:predicted MFS family arabinose efflux permease